MLPGASPAPVGTTAPEFSDARNMTGARVREDRYFAASALYASRRDCHGGESPGPSGEQTIDR